MNKINEDFWDNNKPDTEQEREIITNKEEQDLFMLEICFKALDVPFIMKTIKQKTHFIQHNVSFTDTEIESINLELDVREERDFNIKDKFPDSVFNVPISITEQPMYYCAFCRIKFHTTIAFKSPMEIINTIQNLTLQDKSNNDNPKFTLYCYPLSYKNYDKLLFHRKDFVDGEMRDAFNISREKSGWFYQQQFEQFWYTYIDDEEMLKKLKDTLKRKDLASQWYYLFTKGQPLYRE